MQTTSATLLCALAVSAVVLHAQAHFAQGPTDGQLQASGLANLEERLRTTYEALPRGAGGQPEASAVRYLAQRFLTSEHGRWVHGLDRAPLHALRRNASEDAARRSAELLPAPAGLPPADRAALLAVQRSEPGRGFSLREAAGFVHALENVLANTDMMVMRRAHVLAKRLANGASPKLRSVLMTYAALHMSGTEAKDLYQQGLKEPKARRRLEEEIQNTVEKLRGDIAGEPLEEVLTRAERAMEPAAAGAAPRKGHRALDGMRLLRSRLDARQVYECSKFHGVLRSMDHGGTGQVSYRNTFGVTMKDWAMLETPEYLGAVGALAKRSKKDAGPGVLIPNYVTGMNSCRDTSSWHASICCPDECELEILPRLEAAAGGPRLSPKQVWLAVQQPLATSGLHGTQGRKALRSQLRRLGTRSPDGKLAVHGRPLGRWLHGAFPHKCRKPVAAGRPLVVDPTLSPTQWERGGKHLPLDAPEIKEVRAHLQRRWGPDGTGESAASFAARSHWGLDAELLMIPGFIEVHKAGGPTVAQQMEAKLNVRVMERKPDHILHLCAVVAAAGFLGLALLLRAAVARCAPLLALPSRVQALAATGLAFVACAAACITVVAKAGTRRALNGLGHSAAGAKAGARRALDGLGLARAASARAGAGAAAGARHVRAAQEHTSAALAGACALAWAWAARAGAALPRATAAPVECSRRVRAAVGGWLAGLCTAAASTLLALAESLGRLGQELAAASKAPGKPRAQRSERRRGANEAEDSTDTGETDSDVVAEPSSDSDMDEIAKRKRVYSRATLLKFCVAEKEANAATDATKEEAEEEEDLSAGSTDEPSVADTWSMDGSPKLEQLPESPFGGPFGHFRPPPGLEAPPGLEDVLPSPPEAEEPPQPRVLQPPAAQPERRHLSALLAAPQSLRPSRPVPSAKTQRPVAAPPQDEPPPSFVPSWCQPLAPKPEQWCSTATAGAEPPLPDPGWRRPQPKPEPEPSWRRPGPEPGWRSSAPGADRRPAPAAAAAPGLGVTEGKANEGDLLMAFVCKQLQGI